MVPLPDGPHSLVHSLLRGHTVCVCRAPSRPGHHHKKEIKIKCLFKKQVQCDGCGCGFAQTLGAKMVLV